MWFRTWTHALVTVLLAITCEGLVVIGPKFIRPGKDHSVVISSFDEASNNADVTLTVKGTAYNGEKILSVTRDVKVRPNGNTVVSFLMPPNLTQGYYDFSIDGRNGFNLHEEATLNLIDRNVSALIQMSKPIFKPGETVNFRVIVLDDDLKPPVWMKNVLVTVRDPHGNVIRKWPSANLNVGVFEGDLQIATVPIFGSYKISADIHGYEPASKTFEVKEYTLSTYDVQVHTREVPLAKHQRLKLTVVASYNVGQPVKGTAVIELYLQNDKLDQRKVVDMYGTVPVELRFNKLFSMDEDSRDVRVKIAFTQEGTNRTITKEQHITVYKNQYRVELVKERPFFTPKMSFKCALRLTHHDGRPANKVPAVVRVEDDDVSNYTFNASHVSDDAGMIQLSFVPDIRSQTIQISVMIADDHHFDEQIFKQNPKNIFVKITLASAIEPNKILKMNVTSSETISFFLYYVVCKGNIVSFGHMLPRATDYSLPIKATDEMVPKATVIVLAVSNDQVVYDFVTVVFNDLKNNFNLKLANTEVQPGGQLELTMTGRSGAYLALGAYDKALLQHGNNHDLLWQDIMDVLDGFYGVEKNEFDYFHEVGLFVCLSEHMNFQDVQFHADSGRFGFMEKLLASKNRKESFRTNFDESFLWKTTTIGPSGSSSMKEVVPDSVATWHVTGFSIDPVDGFGIIKQPIQFTTVQSFYIIDSLPYSIKRGEVAVLQFIVFNRFPKTYEASVTLFNVGNQTEFIGTPQNEKEYTKSISVPPDTGVPVSFLVKPRKLGEMTVRVKAAIDPAVDTIERVIRVLPESLVHWKMDTRVFCHNDYQNQTFDVKLDVDKQADEGSSMVYFTLTPNLLTTVMDNLEHLLSVPSGCGEQNMVRFVPNVMVLDYLTATESTNKVLTKKATELLKKGYQNQLQYRQPDGSFGLWQKSGGGVFLTAFVGKTLATASKYISEVEPAMVMKAYDWLAKQQESSGRFKEVGAIFHRDMQGGLREGIALTSYVLIALLEYPKAAEKHAGVIRKGVTYITDKLDGVNDSYDLAIATYVLMLHGHASKDRFLEKLIGMSSVQQNGTERYWKRNANEIETTAYALLSFALAERYLDGTAIMRWLVKQRYHTGSFPRTQDTFVGLKALTFLTEKISPARNDYRVMLRSSGKHKEFRVDTLDPGSLKHSQAVKDPLRMKMDVLGRGFGVLQLAYEYSVDVRNYTSRFNLKLKKTLSSGDNRLKLQVCASYIPRMTDTLSNMVLVEVNFPSGYVVDRVDDENKHNTIKKTEFRYDRTSVVLYYNNMGTENNCFTAMADRKHKVVLKRPAYVLVHDYYDLTSRAIQMYQVDDRGLCDVCENDGCPSTCSS